MIVAVAPAGLTERQRGGVGGAAAGDIAPCISVPAAASAGPGVAAPQVISHTYGPLPTLTDSGARYAEVATSPVRTTPTAVIRADCGGPGQQQQPHPAPPGAVHSTATGENIKTSSGQLYTITLLLYSHCGGRVVRLQAPPHNILPCRHSGFLYLQSSLMSQRRHFSQITGPCLYLNLTTLMYYSHCGRRRSVSAALVLSERAAAVFCTVH